MVDGLLLIGAGGLEGLEGREGGRCGEVAPGHHWHVVSGTHKPAAVFFFDRIFFCENLEVSLFKSR